MVCYVPYFTQKYINTYRSKYKKTPVCQHDTGRKIG